MARTAEGRTLVYGGEIDIFDNNDPRTLIVRMIGDGARVLEVGPGAGPICRYLSHVKGCRVTAVEVSPQMAQAAAPFIYRMICGDIENDAILRAATVDAPYDYIIFADVLEHLADPWQVLRAMGKLLAHEGRILVSLPNVAHWSVRLGLLFGRFDYTNGFLMDRTHLRFFTLRSARQMFASCGYVIEEERVRWAPFPGDRWWRCFPPLRNALNTILTHLTPGLYGYQFVFKLRRSDEG